MSVNATVTDVFRLKAEPRPFGEVGAHRYLLAVLVFLLPVQLETSRGINFALSDVVLLLVLILGIARMRTSRSDWSLWHVLLLPLLWFGAINTYLSYGFISRWAVLNKFVGIVVLLLLYLVVVQYARSLEAVRHLAKLLLYSVIIQAAIALPMYFVGLVYPPFHTARISGFLLDPNAYGGFMVVGLCLHWSTVNTRCQLVGRALAGATSALILLNLFFTFSRSSWIGLAVVLVVAPLINRRCWRHVVIPPAIGVALVLLVFRSYFMRKLLPLVLRPQQITGRLNIIDNAIGSFLSHPLFGAGLGSFLHQNGVQVHNSFMWMLAELGVVGAGVFVGFVTWFVFRGVRAHRHVGPGYRELVAGLLTAHLAMIGLSLGIEAFYQRYWWVVMALLSASCTASARLRQPTTEPASRRDDSHDGIRGLEKAY